MRKWARIVSVATLVGSAVVSAGVADAGVVPQEPTIGLISITLRVIGPEAANLDAAWEPELYVSGADEFGIHCNTNSGFNQPLLAFRAYGCDVHEPTTFTLGFPTLPEPYRVEWSCGSGLPGEAFPDESATFTIDGDATTDVFCDIVMSTGMVLLDKKFPADESAQGTPGPDPDGGAEHGDFTLEVYTADGDGELVASGTDDDPNTCGNFEDAANGVCLLLLVPPGDYVLGEVATPGYRPVDVACEYFGSPFALERFPVEEATTFTIDAEPGSSYYCAIANQYYEGSVTLTKTLTNDNGGTAELGDFTLELYRAGDGTPIATGVCGNDGVCLDGVYPIGDYIVGEIGPDGYTRIVTQQIGLPAEQLTEPQAAFTLEPFASVTVNVASDDQPPAPTTTTTTTTAPTTTVDPNAGAPTTQGPTTSAIDAGVVTLPPTGSSSNTGQLAAVAIGLLLLGVGTTAFARRRT